MKIGDDGNAVPGSYPISTVSLGMWGENDKPMPTVESAVCDVCSGWASNIWTAGETKTATDDLLSDVRISRRTQVVVYACPEHSHAVADALVEEYGAASNVYEPDDLALEMKARQVWR